MSKTMLRIGKDFVITNNTQQHPFDEYKSNNEKWILSIILKFRIKKEEKEKNENEIIISPPEIVELFVWRRCLIKKEKDEHEEDIFNFLNQFYNKPEMIYLSSPSEDNPNKYFYERNYNDKFNLFNIYYSYNFEYGDKFRTTKINLLYKRADERQEIEFENYQELENGFVIPKFNLLSESNQKFIKLFCRSENFLTIYEFIEFNILHYMFFTNKIYPKRIGKNTIVELSMDEDEFILCNENEGNSHKNFNIIEIEFIKDENQNLYNIGYLYVGEDKDNEKNE